MYIDWAELLRSVSVFLAGAFGILALLTDYKVPKTKKLTRWGRISLGGIILSTVLGLTTQIIDNAKKKESARKDLAESKDLATRTRDSLDGIRRLLSPFNVKKIEIIFRGSCDDPELANICKTAQMRFQGAAHTTKNINLVRKKFGNFEALVAFFNGKTQCYNETRSSLQYSVEVPFWGTRDLDDPVLDDWRLIKRGNNIDIMIDASTHAWNYRTGFDSVMDLPDSTISIRMLSTFQNRLKLSYVVLYTDAGRSVILDGDQFQIMRSGGAGYGQCLMMHFPKDWNALTPRELILSR